MGPTICLLTCALAVAQPADRGDWVLTPQLARGQELVYSGSFVEEALSPNVQFQRSYRIDATALVLDAKQDKFDLAILTVVSTKTAKSPQATGAQAATPASVRLETLTLDKLGKLRTATAGALLVPIEGPPTLECGAFVEVPRTRVGVNSWWESNEEGRTPRTWRVDGTEIVNNVKCVRLVGVQQSEDWGTPRADSTAWQRRDTVWISPQLGVACRFERVLERRAAARDGVTHRSVLKCELETGLTRMGKLFDDRAAEIQQARKVSLDAEAHLRDPEQHKMALEGLLKRIKQHVDTVPPTNVYRKAVVQVQKRIEAALRGETVPAPEADAGVPRVAVGERVPDFVCTDLLTRDTQRLQRLLGRPVLVVFFNPATENGTSALRYAQSVADRHRGD